jgi:hypothetical protein
LSYACPKPGRQVDNIAAFFGERKVRSESFGNIFFVESDAAFVVCEKEYEIENRKVKRKMNRIGKL